MTYRVRSERNGESIYIGRYFDESIADCAALYLNELLHNEIILPIKDIKKMVLLKYPQPCKKNPKTGFIGVKKYGAFYSAYIFHNKSKIRIGKHYNTAEEAHAAYLKAKEEYAHKPKIQLAPPEGNISIDKIQRAVDSVSLC